MWALNTLNSILVLNLELIMSFLLSLKFVQSVREWGKLAQHKSRLKYLPAQHEVIGRAVNQLPIKPYKI